MEREKSKCLRALPAVHEVLANLAERQEFKPVLSTGEGVQRLTDLTRYVLQEARDKLLANPSEEKQDEGLWQLPVEEFESRIWAWLWLRLSQELTKEHTSLRRVINATGVVLHTNLGRALLAPWIADFVAEQAGRYSNLELNIATGERGSRYEHVEQLLCTLTGAEAALVVNNNAAAVLLVMNTLANNQEVIVSRGELVEVGGAFRIPEVLKLGGAKLVEVGTTNKTWLSDYEKAIGPETAMLLKVHTSNYRIEGFTHAVSGQELVKLGGSSGLPVVEDLGSGSFLDGVELGFPAEPTIGQSVKAGLALVTFSGDKLLGGPQAGIIVGQRRYVELLRANQLLRALRIDKLTLAALEGTLRLYEQGRSKDIPVWQMLALTSEVLKERAEQLALDLAGSEIFQVEVQASSSQVGGGAWPTVSLPTWVCAVRPYQGSVQDLEQFLRQGSPAILTRIQKDWVLLDGRTFLEGDHQEIVRRCCAFNYEKV